MYSKEYLIEEYVNKRRTRTELVNEHLQMYGYKGDIQRALVKYDLVSSKHRYKYTLNEDKIDLKYPEFAYYLGLILTDGYIHYARRYVLITLTNEDAPLIFESIRHFLEYTGPVREYTYKYRDEIRPRWDLRITSDRLIDYLAEIGVPQGPKSFSVKIPDKFPDDVSAALFFRGILDGDGCISHKNFKILKGSIPFIQGITDFINSRFDKSYTVKIKRMKQGSYPELTLNTADTKLFLDWVYAPGFDNFRMLHKYGTYITRFN